MDQNNESKRKLSPRMIAILVLALIVLAECAFLLLHHRQNPGAGAARTDVSAASAPAATASAGEKEPAPDAGSQTTAAPQTTASADQTQKSGSDKSGSKSENGSKDSSKTGSDTANVVIDPSGSASPAPAQSPAVSVPPENKDKPYAAAIAALEGYAREPSETALASLLGGELLGEQMQKFLPALLDMSGQDVMLLYTQMDAAMELPENTTSLTITDAQPLSTGDIDTAQERVRTMQSSFSAISQGFSDYVGFTESEWDSIGSQLGLTGAEAKRMISDLTTSSKTMAELLNGAEISEAYLVTMKTNTGATAQTNVYCIAGRWVTTAFFNMEFA